MRATFIFGLLLIVAASVTAQVPNQICYQGNLTTSTGTPVNGPINITFRFYNTASGPSPSGPLWSSGLQSVTCANGAFTVYLGAPPMPAIGPALVADSSLYLEITVGDDPAGPELTPRARLVTQPYAYLAATANTASQAASVSNGGVTSSAIADGAIQFGDIGQNGASSGQVIKWNGSAWAAANDSSVSKAATAALADSAATMRIDALDSSNVRDGSLASADIKNGTILFTDLSQNGAATGQIMKWNGSAWVAANDSVGSGAGSFLPLAGGTMTGPITSTGNPAITMGKGNFGTGNTNTGSNALAAGNACSAQGTASTAFGRQNTAIGDYAAALGGFNNMCNAHYGVELGGNNDSALGNYSLVLGGQYNKTTTGGFYSTVAGGQQGCASAGWGFIGGGWMDTIMANYSAVVGGYNNRVTASATSGMVAGGSSNRVDGISGFVGGGSSNTVTGNYGAIVGGLGSTGLGGCFIASSTDCYAAAGSICIGGFDDSAKGYRSVVIGGNESKAEGDYSFALGTKSTAQHEGSFVWSDHYVGSYPVSERNNQMRLRANGGVRLDINSFLGRWVNVYDDGTNVITANSGARLTVGGTWTNASDRNRKTDFVEVDGQLLLEKITALPIMQWRYRDDSTNVRHIGPTAQDFYTTFGLGGDTTSISTVDPSGIALVAVKELTKKNQKLQDENATLRARLEDLEKKVAQLAKDK